MVVVKGQAMTTWETKQIGSMYAVLFQGKEIALCASWQGALQSLLDSKRDFHLRGIDPTQGHAKVPCTGQGTMASATSNAAEPSSSTSSTSRAASRTDCVASAAFPASRSMVRPKSSSGFIQGASASSRDSSGFFGAVILDSVSDTTLDCNGTDIVKDNRLR